MAAKRSIFEEVSGEDVAKPAAQPGMIDRGRSGARRAAIDQSCTHPILQCLDPLRDCRGGDRQLCRGYIKAAMAQDD